MAFKSIITIVLLHVSVFVFSQNIERSSYFSSTGNYKNSGTLQLQYNIGELMSDSYTGAQNMMTNGFVQPEPSLSVSVGTVINSGNCVLYPNPVSGNLFVLLELQDYSDVTSEVFDVLGKKQLTEMISNNNKGKYTGELNFEKLSSGIYFVRIISAKNQFNRTFKVSKS